MGKDKKTTAKGGVDSSSEVKDLAAVLTEYVAFKAQAAARNTLLHCTSADDAGSGGGPRLGRPYASAAAAGRGGGGRPPEISALECF